MAVPEDMGHDLLAGEVLPARDLLDPGLLCQAVLNAVLVLRCPELRPGKSHSWMACSSGLTPDSSTRTLASGCQTPESAGFDRMPHIDFLVEKGLF